MSAYELNRICEISSSKQGVNRCLWALACIRGRSIADGAGMLRAAAPAWEDRGTGMRAYMRVRVCAFVRLSFVMKASRGIKRETEIAKASTAGRVVRPRAEGAAHEQARGHVCWGIQRTCTQHAERHMCQHVSNVGYDEATRPSSLHRWQFFSCSNLCVCVQCGMPGYSHTTPSSPASYNAIITSINNA